MAGPHVLPHTAGGSEDLAGNTLVVAEGFPQQARVRLEVRHIGTKQQEHDLDNEVHGVMRERKVAVKHLIARRGLQNAGRTARKRRVRHIGDYNRRRLRIDGIVHHMV